MRIAASLSDFHPLIIEIFSFSFFLPLIDWQSASSCGFRRRVLPLLCWKVAVKFSLLLLHVFARSLQSWSRLEWGEAVWRRKAVAGEMAVLENGGRQAGRQAGSEVSGE